MNAVVVGYGAIGPVHAYAINECNEATLYGICDIDKARANAGAKEYQCKAFYSFGECLMDEAVDVIHICTPHYLHYEMITKALMQGKRVVCEKPVVMTKQELDSLCQHYDTKRIFPIVQNRTNDCIEKLKEIVQNDREIGELKGIKAIVTWARDAAYYNSDDWRGQKNREGGGVLINQAIHALDLMMLFGGKATRVMSSMMNYSLKDVIDVEDTVSAFIQFETGAKGVFFATNAYSRDSAVELELHFENRVFLYADGKLYADKKLICEDSSEFLGKQYWGKGHLKTLHDYYVQSSKFCLDDVKHTMDVLFAIYESAEKQTEVILPINTKTT